MGISEETYNKYKKIMKAGFCLINTNRETHHKLEEEFGWNPTIAWNYIS